MMQRIDEDNDVVVQSCRSTTGKCKSIEITQLTMMMMMMMMTASKSNKKTEGVSFERTRMNSSSLPFITF
tara:strand:+ start:1301 stop:1510 length:210 start_codon:yes stop_codon:yes gene_type:complete